MLKVSKIVVPDSFIAPLMEKHIIDLAAEETTLKEQFQEEYMDEIQNLWACFLKDVKIRRIAIEHPLLNTRLEDTPLSNRAKNTLRDLYVHSVADLAAFSPKELLTFGKIGKKTLTEIVDYMKEVLG